MQYIIIQRINDGRFLYLHRDCKQWVGKIENCARLSYEQAMSIHNEGGRYVVPDIIYTARITPATKIALARVYLGGHEALQTENHKTARRVIDNLVSLGLLGENGQLTNDGKLLGKYYADKGMI